MRIILSKWMATKVQHSGSARLDDTKQTIRVRDLDVNRTADFQANGPSSQSCFSSSNKNFLCVFYLFNVKAFACETGLLWWRLMWPKPLNLLRFKSHEIAPEQFTEPHNNLNSTKLFHKSCSTRVGTIRHSHFNIIGHAVTNNKKNKHTR